MQNIFRWSLLVCFFISTSTVAQFTITAKVVDSKSNNSIPFATVKFVGKGGITAVISNIDGGFQIPSYYRATVDSVIILCIGYQNKKLTLSQFVENELNIIKLNESVTSLSEVVVKGGRQGILTSEKIVQAAIDNIPINYPDEPTGYIGYYRDYQYKDNQYINLNEAIVKVTDKGFNTNDYDNTWILLYDYKRNTEFKRDSLLDISYDNKNNKFISGATISSQGGNELGILRTHDAIRNYKELSYSYVNVLHDNFIKNHYLDHYKTVMFNGTPLYVIPFRSMLTATGKLHAAKGNIYIDKKNFAIYKFEYTLLEKVREWKELFSVREEYTKSEAKMVLSYISFSNTFKMKGVTDFIVKDVVYSLPDSTFNIYFNHPPEAYSATNKNNYRFALNNKELEIGQIKLLKENNKYYAKIKVRSRIENPSLLVSNTIITYNNIKDADGNELNKAKTVSVNQFRELFVQKTTTPEKRATIMCVNKKRPLSESFIYKKMELEVPDSGYWMNTPLIQAKPAEPKRENQLQNKNQGHIVNAGHDNTLRLLEKTYVHTDRSVYRIDESIWFKVYMNYYSPLDKDTLSKVIYVDLVDVNQKVITTKIFPMNNYSTYMGVISLDAVIKGDYQLRAYTRWMLNFSKPLIFTKTIKVLDSFEEIKERKFLPSHNTNIEISLNKEMFYPKDTVAIKLQTKKSTQADLSISISELNYSSSGENEPSISKDFLLSEQDKQNALLREPLLPIQYGIDLSGHIAMPGNKKKFNNVNLLFIEEDPKKEGMPKDVFPIKATADKPFRFPGLQLYDSSKLWVEAMNIEHNIQGNVVFDSVNISPKVTPFLPLPMVVEWKKSKNMTDINIDSASTYFLKEVTIESSRLVNVKRPYTGLVDRVVSGDELRKSYSGNLVTALALIPELQKAGGLKLGYTGQGDTQPLVVIDGQVMHSDQPGMLLEDWLAPYSVSDIDRIEVSRFAGAATYGVRGGNGVIYVYTNFLKDKTTTSKPKPLLDKTKFQKVNVRGYSAPGKFAPSVFSSTLYWNPEVNIDEKQNSVSFIIPDRAGQYLIHIEGVTSEGKAVSGSKIIKIKQP